MRKTIAILALSIPCVAHSGDFGINVYGLSYHVERERAKEMGVNSEFNPGIGLRYRAPINESFDWLLETGIYRDSGRNTAIVGGPGVLWKMTKDIGVGGALAFFNSKTYNYGKAFAAPVPIVAYNVSDSITLNTTYMPRIKGMNQVSGFGFWLTFKL